MPSPNPNDMPIPPDTPEGQYAAKLMDFALIDGVLPGMKSELFPYQKVRVANCLLLTMEGRRICE